QKIAGRGAAQQYAVIVNRVPFGRIQQVVIVVMCHDLSIKATQNIPCCARDRRKQSAIVKAACTLSGVGDGLTKAGHVYAFQQAGKSD
ncbi:MAG TPA: hypothetical protein GX700_14880, partial [Paracoccus sp.]|nr:hypothetical protein [Paracoccus sp. (in: a-proteobacteria)]